MAPPRELVHRLSTPESKIALFRSLFRGRDDVYPRRFESRRTGKSVSARCANERQACAGSRRSVRRLPRAEVFRYG